MSEDIGVSRRVLVVVGTRPEAIKMAPVVDALRGHSPHVETSVALTGQHTHLVDQVLEAFALEPDYDLGPLVYASNTLTYRMFVIEP